MLSKVEEVNRIFTPVVYSVFIFQSDNASLSLPANLQSFMSFVAGMALTNYCLTLVGPYEPPTRKLGTFTRESHS